MGKHKIEIEKGKWRNQEICLVDFPEIHCLYAPSSQHEDAGQYHSQH